MICASRKTKFSEEFLEGALRSSLWSFEKERREFQLIVQRGRTSKLFEFIRKVRSNEWGFSQRDGKALAALTTIAESTLVIIGQTDSGTGWHVDRSRACNIGYLVNTASQTDSEESLPIATWTFVHPSKASEAHSALQDLGHPRGLHDTHSIPVVDSLQLQKVLGSNQSGHLWVQIIRQYPGDMVTVPVGYIHSVRNHLPNIKFAWDHLVPTDLPACVRTWRETIAAKVTDCAADYSGIFPMMRRTILGAALEQDS